MLDLSLYFSDPNSVEFLLYITPLAPLSMVNSLPGNYFHTEDRPTKYMLCGLFENILDLHFSESERKELRKVLQKKYKIQFSDSPTGYKALLEPLFEILDPVCIPAMIRYEDTWTIHMKAGDSRHMDGARNNDWRIESAISNLSENDKNTFFSENKGRFPNYYAGPKRREYLVCKSGKYIIKIKTNKSLYESLKIAIQNNNLGYLGNSEGWVDLFIN
jgi:CRISPR-associated protein Cas5